MYWNEIIWIANFAIRYTSYMSIKYKSLLKLEKSLGILHEKKKTERNDNQNDYY